MVKHATTKETIEIHEILKRVIMVHEGGLCSYIPGYNDAKVASEVSPNLSKHSVMNVRVKLFGNLFNRTELPSDENDIEKKLHEAVRASENAISSATAAIRTAEEAARIVNNLVDVSNDLQIRFDKLVTMLSLNQIIDCKHLHSTKKNGDKK